MSFTLVNVLLSRSQFGEGGVVLQVGGSLLQTLSTTNGGSKGISPVYFHTERIVVSLKAVLQKLLKVLRNSILENVLSPY